MRVKDLQEFLAKFTEGKSDGSRRGNAVSNAVIFVEKDGRLHEIRRMEVHEHGDDGSPARWRGLKSSFAITIHSLSPHPGLDTRHDTPRSTLSS